MFKSYTYIANSNNLKQRLKSSSGGIFFEIAKEIIEQKGIVFGAAFNKDWNVDIIGVTNLDDLQKLCGSKYVIANVNNAYAKVEQALKGGKMVLFSGTPCQINGLKKALKNNYDNLICVSVVCHGGMPRNIWQDYLNSIKIPFAKIKSINFRDKTNGWRNYNFRIDYDDGRSFIENHKDNVYMKIFLSDEYLLESCYHCRFKNDNNLADISLGDFWSSYGEQYKKFDDDKGTSVVCIRTQQGENLINKLTTIIKEKIPFQQCSVSNNGWKNDIHVIPKKYNPDLFFKHKTIYRHNNCQQNDIFANINNMSDSNKNNSYDYLIINLWDSLNYGANLTAWAMQELLKNFGFSSKNLNVKNYLTTVRENTPSKHFSDKYLNTTELIKPNELSQINAEYTGAIVGSDQVFRLAFLENIDWYFLNFVKNSKKKIALSASFGIDKNEFLNYSGFTSEIREKLAFALNSFDYLSCRELSGKEIYKDIFMLESDVILDPVFLIDKEKYHQLIESSTKEYTNKIIAYTLIDREEYKDIFNFIENREKIEIFHINDANRGEMLEVIDWIKALYDAKYIITDSYHGVCFALIFNKPFFYIVEREKGAARFDSLSTIFNIKDRFINSIDDIKNKNLSFEMDFTSINRIYQSEQKRCLDILKKVFFENYSNNNHARYGKLLNDLYIKNAELKAKQNNANQEIQLLKEDNKRLKDQIEINSKFVNRVKRTIAYRMLRKIKKIYKKIFNKK